MAKILEAELTSMNPLTVMLELDNEAVLRFNTIPSIQNMLRRHGLDVSQFVLDDLLGKEYVADVPEPFSKLHTAFAALDSTLDANGKNVHAFLRDEQKNHFAHVDAIRTLFGTVWELLETVTDGGGLSCRPPPPRR